jgi:serine/threonine-protein kinase HipA
VLAELGQRLQAHRLNANLSQAEVAQKAGVSRRALQNLESGRVCTLSLLIRVLRALGKLHQLEENREWRLSPAFDVTWSFNPSGSWTNRHQMSLNGKRDDFTRDDLAIVARQFGVKDDHDLIEQVATSVSAWPRFAKEAGVRKDQQKAIAQTHRLALVTKHHT